MLSSDITLSNQIKSVSKTIKHMRELDWKINLSCSCLRVCCYCVLNSEGVFYLDVTVGFWMSLLS